MRHESRKNSQSCGIHSTLLKRTEDEAGRFKSLKEEEKERVIRLVAMEDCGRDSINRSNKATLSVEEVSRRTVKDKLRRRLKTH
jgi:hypothetical protein